MNTLDNVRKAFSPLGERLHFFESGLHLLPNNDHDLEINQHDYFYPAMIDKVGLDVNAHDTNEVYNIANEYLFRANRVLELLNEQKKKNKDINEIKWDMWASEIYEYLHQLLVILDAREDIYQSKTNTTVTNKSIQLPENFTIRELQVHFKPKYPHSTITLLMYYMSKVGIMPPYDQGQYGKVASIFGFHNKTIAKDMRHLSIESKSDLMKVQKVVETLLDAITEDLANTKKR